jgi:hypothetical protein
MLVFRVTATMAALNPRERVHCAPNVHAQRPRCEQREPPVRCSVMLGGTTSFNHLIRPLQQRLRDREPERLRRFQVDNQLELGWLLNGQVRGFRSLEDLVDEDGRAAVLVGLVRSMVH